MADEGMTKPDHVLHIALDYIALTDTGALVFCIEDQGDNPAGPSRTLEQMTNKAIRAHLAGGFDDVQDMDDEGRAVVELLAKRLEAEAARLRFFAVHDTSPPYDAA